MDVNGGQVTQTAGNPVFPGTTVTGPYLAGNVIRSDGTNNLAGLAETTGTANVGYATMGQSAVITQATLTVTTPIVIPAQSQITGMQLMVTTEWTGTTTLGIGATAGTSAATAFTGATGVQGSTFGLVVINPGTASGTIPANWDNVSNSTFQTAPSDVQILVTNGGTGSGVGTLTVFYLQGINNAS
jgi:hypothetical protein